MAFFKDDIAPAKSTSSMMKKSMSGALKKISKGLFVPPKEDNLAAVMLQHHYQMPRKL